MKWAQKGLRIYRNENKNKKYKNRNRNKKYRISFCLKM